MQDYGNSGFILWNFLKKMEHKVKSNTLQNMKTAKTFVIATAAMLSLPFFQSCDRHDTPDYSILYPNAIVTVKPIDDKAFYLQLDDKTALLPVGTGKLPYGDKEVRAFVNFTYTDMPQDADKDKYEGAVKINWLDSLLTKQPKADMGAENDKLYGKDPVEIMNNWMTVVEDGYITLNFMTVWGNRNTSHEVNLLTGGNPDDPYEVEFRHNAFGDVNGQRGNGIVAFSLKDLPDTGGETVKLTLKWMSFSGMKSTKFDYCTRKDM